MLCTLCLTGKCFTRDSKLVLHVLSIKNCLQKFVMMEYTPTTMTNDSVFDIGCCCYHRVNDPILYLI